MNRIRLFILIVPVMLVACQSVRDRDTIANLRHVQIEIKEEKIEGGIEKAMRSYERFLEDTPDSALAPEAIRRLADLKIEKEYGSLTEAEGSKPSTSLPAPERTEILRDDAAGGGSLNPALPSQGATRESEEDFERRALQPFQTVDKDEGAASKKEGGNDLEKASAREAIELYKKLLNDYPLYKRNDQVLYQMSRAYEELGETEAAMEVMNRLVSDFPESRYIDEVQFRRAEYFFTRKRYLDAEEAYGSIVKIGVGSFYYELALYKMGWTFYKQELYEESLDRFIALLDHKVSIGYDFKQTEDEQEQKRTEDTFRVISLGFSNLGGSKSVVEYFSRSGKRSYEDGVYSNLGEFYYDKRRYADASATYNAFVSRNPFHKMAPNFQMRVIEIHAAGGFPSLVLDSKKDFAKTYGLKSEYWNYFDPGEREDVLGYLKTNLRDLANHYHACYQDPKQADKKSANFEEARHWYREFLDSFPHDDESPSINYQFADLLLENRSFGLAAVEYEKIAYDYPRHEKSSSAGYAAVYAYRQHLDTVTPEDMDTVKREVVRSSLKFADTFPEHEKAGIILGAAADDLYSLKEYEQARDAAQKLLDRFPDVDVEVARSAWLVIGHSSYELQKYEEAETAYLHVLTLLPEGDETREGLVDNLAASIYKQGEQAEAAGEYRMAADHFLRVSRMAPTSKIRPNAEFDAAAALIHLKDWEEASSVLLGFRDNFPDHPLQPEVTKKIAFVYRENGQLSSAANEYERIEKESDDEEIRKDALLVAAELHEKDGNSMGALEVYRRYVDYFPQPVELNLETRNKIAEILKAQNDRESYLQELGEIVAIDASAGSDRTPRTKYLAAQSALVLAEVQYEAFAAVRLVKPFEVNLREKRELMKQATQAFNRLMDYEFGEFTAAATFYLAEIYAHFSQALLTSERPEGLSAEEREEYELAIEDQAYPFEEKAIEVHENNLKLISLGIYNGWIEKSLQKLAEFVPARYDKHEEADIIVSSLDTYIYEIERNTPLELTEPEEAGAEPLQEPGITTESLSEETEPLPPEIIPAPQPDKEEPDHESVTLVAPPKPGKDPGTEAGFQNEPGEEPLPLAGPETPAAGKFDPSASDPGRELGDEPIPSAETPKRGPDDQPLPLFMEGAGPPDPEKIDQSESVTKTDSVEPGGTDESRLRDEP